MSADRSALEAALSGTLVIRDLRIVYASDGIGAVVGRDPAALAGTKVLELVATEDRARLADRHERRLRGEPVPSEYETTVALPDGRRRVVEFTIARDGRDFVIRVRDVSAQAAQRPRLESLAALGAAIQHERSEGDVFAKVAEGLWQLGLSSALARAEPDGIRVEWARMPEPIDVAFRTHLGRGYAGYRGRWSTFARAAWDEGASYTDDWGTVAGQVVPDERSDETRALAARLGLSHAIAVRLDERAAVRFYLVVMGDWLQAGDVAAFRLFGAQIAAALDASRAIADLSRRNAELAALNRIGELAGECGDLAEFFRAGTAVLREAAGIAGLGLFVVDPRAGELVAVFHDGISAEAAARVSRVPLNDPLAEVVRDRLARVVDRRDPGGEILAELGFDASAWVPLVARSRVLGVMATGFRVPPERVRARLDVIAAAGAHFASAIESHGLLADLRRRVGELTLLNDLAVASAQLDPVLLLDAALRRLTETLSAEVAAGYLRDGERLLLVAGVGMAPASARAIAQLVVGEGTAGLAVERLAPVVSEDVRQLGGRCAPFGADEDVGPSAAVPLLAKTQALGAIVLGRRGARPFEDGEVALLSAIGVQLGVAVENARLFADVRRRLSDLEAVHALALRIFGNAPGDVRALLEDGCREAARALSCRAAVVLLLAEDGRTLRGVAGFGAPIPPERIALVLDDDALATEAFRRRAPAWSEDVTRDARSTLRAIEGVPPLAMLVVPLASRAATRGVLFVADDAGRAFTDPELALANALAVELAVGLENAELYAEARRRVEELSLLNEMGRTVAASLDLDRVLREGVEAARRLLEASGGYVVLYDPQLSELRVAVGTGLSPQDLDGSRAALGDRGVAARAIRERRAIVVDDARADPAVSAEVPGRLAPRALLAAPLLLRGEPLGVLVVDESRRLRRFSEADVQRVTAVANQLAVAIENARLYAEARGRLSELSTVIDVARVVSSSLELEEVLGAGAEHLKRTLQGSACTILLGDGRAPTLRRAASRGAPIGEDRVALERPSLAREALEARAPVAGRVAPGPDGAAETALLAVPLHVRDQPVGVALVARADPDLAFTPGELSRAMAIASQLAIAVDNARLYSETRRRAEELGLLHEVGRSLVATLEIEQVLDAGVKNLARIVDCPEAYLALATDDGEHLEIRAVTSAMQGALGRRLPLRSADASLGAQVFERRAPAAIEDAAQDPRGGREPRPGEGAARACLALPLLVRDRTIGSAVIIDTRGPRRFSAQEVERAAAIANQLAVAAENARLYEDLRKSYAELARAQRQLIQQERLAALGELSAVVAHEVRNPLGVIFNSLGSLRRMLRPSGDAKMLLDIVGEEADRLNRIVGDLLDFARPSTPQLRPEPLERIVDEAVQAALAQNSGVQLAREADPAVPPVPMDARLMRQAVLNVAVNAVQAMPRGGRLSVRLRREDGAALLEIEDTGAGIPEEVRHRIFEPFFTTKASGTGLGLAVVKRIVEGHGGEIAVRSRPGAGTTFSLRFPLAAPPEGTKEGELG